MFHASIEMLPRIKGAYKTLICITSVFILLTQIKNLKLSLLSARPTTLLDANSPFSSNDSKYLLFSTKQLVIWSNDYHISLINDLKHLLQPFGVKFIDKSLSGHCHVTKTCEGKKNTPHYQPRLYHVTESITDSTIR